MVRSAGRVMRDDMDAEMPIMTRSRGRQRTFAELVLGGFRALIYITRPLMHATTVRFCSFVEGNGIHGGGIVTRRKCVRDVHDEFLPKCRNAEISGIDQTLLGMHQKT